MAKIEYVMIGSDRYALVPYALFDSFSRTYVHISAFARGKGLREITLDGERRKIIRWFRENRPRILRFAIGQLEQFIDETDYRFFLVICDNEKPESPVGFEGELVDMTHDEPEFENAIAVFGA